MNHKELMQELQRRIRLDKQQTATLMACLKRIITDDALAVRETVWAGMGRFVSHKHPEYVEQNAATGETVLYPPRITCRFQADRTLEDSGLIGKLADRSGAETETVSMFLARLADCIMEALEKGEEAEITGLGSFSMIDVRQGEARRVAYLPDEKMREAVNAPFSCFEPVVIESRAQAAETPVGEGSGENAPAEPSETPEADTGHDEPEQELQDEPQVDLKDEPQTVVETPVHAEPRRSHWLITAAVALLLILAGAAIWMFAPSQQAEPRKETARPEQPGQAPETDSPVNKDTSHVASDVTTGADTMLSASVVYDTAAPTPAAPQDIAREDSTVRKQPADEQILKENGRPVREELKAGQRLTLVALKYYGSKAFWPYIYEVNRFQIDNPNNVPVGVNLYLPDPVYWGIDSTDERSLTKAKIKAAKLINRQ